MMTTAYRKLVTEADIKRVPRGKVLVRRSTDEEVTIGGIHLPDNKTEKPLKCTVLMLGDSRIKDSGAKEPIVVCDPPLKVGDTVSVRQFYGKNLNLEKDLIIVDGRDIEGVLTSV